MSSRQFCFDGDPDVARWEAVVGRDKGADGLFVYAVRTTGVFCRPGCASRLPRRDNVTFYETAVAARTAGFRPCQRCQPEVGADMHGAAIQRACQLIAASDNLPSLADMARAAGLSPAHFHRVFKVAVGITPRAYAAAQRTTRVQLALQTEPTVTDALYSAGYNASSRFYAAAPAVLGMAPREYLAGAPGQALRWAVTPCYLGWVLVAATERGVCSIELGDDAAELESRLRARFPRAFFSAGDDEFAAVVAQVTACLDVPLRSLNLPLDIQGTAFQRRVWEALRAIPAGQTRSYAEVATAIGQPAATRAVAQACAANQLAVAIPCHRVVRSDGCLSGYRWGPERKRKLLERERL